MARGITETDVHAAADDLVAAGERPTVERIRAHLGTGSPNTVTRWLETWWKTLGGRLQAQRARLAVPDAPEAVAGLAGEWWTLALQHARNEALEALADERSALHAEHRAFQREREDLAAEIASLRKQADAAIHAEQVASAQAAELQRLVNQLEEHSAEMAQQRDAALLRVTQAENERRAAQVRIQELLESADKERDAIIQHARTVEDRAHAEIDRARQKVKDLEVHLANAAQEQVLLKKSQVAAAEEFRLKANEIQRDADIQRARANALEVQLAKLHDLPAALEAAWRRSGPTVVSPKAPSKRSKRRSA
ncbi:DNA-binding protein [Pseudoxanthomonas beigongshangi]|uniref:DNA-binding protein n=1 Tax=Pseudoxanthomonas beigongshangi TaxID=2782537 RepID=UPI00193B08EE|nr:DNA-binding protein [Pseudoxanthomonas beigongshangi]